MLESRIKIFAKSGGFKSKQRTLCSPSNPAKWVITEEYLQDTRPSSIHDPSSVTTPSSVHNFDINAPLDITPSSGHIPGISAGLEVINTSTPQCLPRPVTQRRLNMSAAAVNSCYYY